ncbi:MAG: hypothetical protein OXB92_11370 [Acidimicrobiaceae bacterium]|nr:hypothetical protein [Acidimicrobiia bacterium]MCY4494443.1 hypothetical protein [Acidimicrobiaceae bacterium]
MVDRTWFQSWRILVVTLVSMLLAFVGWFMGPRDSSSDRETATILEFDVEELAVRLDQRRPYDGNVDAEPDKLPTELRVLMSTYGLDAEGAVAQLDAQDKASVAFNWLRETLGEDPRIGGMRIDQGRGGHLVVHVNDSELGRQIVAATNGLLPIYIQVTSVSEKDLEALARQAAEALDLVDSETRLGTGVPYYTVSAELDKERVVIGRSSLAPDEFRRKLEPLSHNPLVVVEDLGPVLFTHGGDE